MAGKRFFNVKKLGAGALVAFLIALFAANRALADGFIFSAPADPAPGSPYEVRLGLTATEQAVNAVSGEIDFPADLLEVKAINDGGSIVNFWVDDPKAADGAVVFSGITPGGFSGENGFILGITFSVKKEGAGQIAIGKIKVLANDGKGTEVAVPESEYSFTVSAANPAPNSEPTADTTPPEAFAPEISSAPDIYNGAKFLVFGTQDKESGIDRYEVAETRSEKPAPADWAPAQSPYLIKDQALGNYIFVKAVDRAGNERVAELWPQMIPWYKNVPNYAIMAWVIILFAVFILALLQWKKTPQKK